jgi:hypothetical protein
MESTASDCTPDQFSFSSVTAKPRNASLGVVTGKGEEMTDHDPALARAEAATKYDEAAGSSFESLLVVA